MKPTIKPCPFCGKQLEFVTLHEYAGLLKIEYAGLLKIEYAEHDNPKCPLDMYDFRGLLLEDWNRRQETDK
jgi:hypothetical protein